MSVTIRRCTESGWVYRIYDADGGIMAMSVKPYGSLSAIVADLHELVGTTYIHG